MFLEKMREMVGRFIIVTTVANNRVQGKILEVGPDYIAIAQEGAPKLRLIPVQAIDNIDMDMPQRPQPPPQGGIGSGPQKPPQPPPQQKGGLFRK